MIVDDENTLSTEEQATLDQMRSDEVTETAEQPVVATPEAEAEAPAEAAEETAPTDERQKTVPHAALHEERERRKETERRLAEAESRSRTLEERTNLILQRFAQPQQEPAQPPPLPDREKDPVAYLEALAMEAKQEAAAARQMLAQRGQQDQQAQVAAMIESHARQKEIAFRLTTPDYDAATAHLLRARHAQLEAAGWADPVERQNQIAYEARSVAARAIQEKADPAERIYGLAKVYGYVAPAAEQPAAPATEQRLAAIDRGQQQNRSLGSVRGGAPPALSAKTVSEMSEDQFGEFLDKATQAQRQAILGS